MWTKAQLKDAGQQIADRCFATGPADWNVASCSTDEYDIFVSARNGFYTTVETTQDIAGVPVVTTSLVAMKRRTESAVAKETGAMLADLD